MPKNTYTVTYEAETFAGQPGFWYRVHRNGREIRSGWSRGGKHHAERMARTDIDSLEARAA